MNHSRTSLIGKVQGTLLTPARPSQWGVLVLGGSSGRVDIQRASIFAGLAARSLALRWFGGDGQAPGICEIPLETFVDAVSTLQDAGRPPEMEELEPFDLLYVDYGPMGLYSLSKGWLTAYTYGFKPFERGRPNYVWARDLSAKQSRFGLMNNEGEWKVEPTFDTVQPLFDGRAVVSVKVKDAETRRQLWGRKAGDPPHLRLAVILGSGLFGGETEWRGRVPGYRGQPSWWQVLQKGRARPARKAVQGAARWQMVRHHRQRETC